LWELYTQAKKLKRNNQLIKAKYDNDEKYARLLKWLMEKALLTDSKLFRYAKAGYQYSSRHPGEGRSPGVSARLRGIKPWMIKNKIIKLVRLGTHSQLFKG